MASQHTPGPWKVEKFTDTKSYTLYGAEPRSLGSIRNLADAQLIAAAPDLLKSLRHAESLIATFSAHGALDRDWILEDVRAAIAKAEGRAS